MYFEMPLDVAILSLGLRFQRSSCFCSSLHSTVGTWYSGFYQTQSAKSEHSTLAEAWLGLNVPLRVLHFF